MKPPEGTTSTQRHYDYLDGLRAVLALYVVCHHAWYTVLDHDRQGISHFYDFLSGGRFAVNFFIVVSGFCLMLPVLKTDFVLPDGAGGFFKRRARRILPPYYAALFISLGLIYFLIHDMTGVGWDMSLPVHWSDVVVHILMLQNLTTFSASKINFVFWSISLEWQIYFAFPLMLWCWRKLGAVWTVLAAAVVSKVIEVTVQHITTVMTSWSFAGFFALGMFACYVSYAPQEASVKFRKIPWAWIALFFGAIVMAEQLTLPPLKRPSVELLFACFAASTLIHISLYPKNWLHRVLDFAPLVWVGGFSYSLYLLHAPLLAILWQYVLVPWQGQTNLVCGLMVVLGAAICVAISYLFFLCFEQPFLKKKGRAIVHVK